MRIEEHGIIYYRCSVSFSKKPPSEFIKYVYRAHSHINKSGFTDNIWCQSRADALELCNRWTNKNWQFYLLGPGKIRITQRSERKQHMTIEVQYAPGIGQSQFSVFSLKEGTTFTGTIRYNYCGTPHQDTGLFLVTSKNARPSDSSQVLMVLDSDLKCPKPYVIDTGFSSIQIENFKKVNVKAVVTG